MGATATRDRQRGAGQDGWSPAEGDFRRTPRLAVTEDQAGLHFARLVVELAERGLKVDYRSVWEFVHAEKLSFKKKRGGWRTRSSRRRPTTSPVDQISRSRRT